METLDKDKMDTAAHTAARNTQSELDKLTESRGKEYSNLVYLVLNLKTICFLIERADTAEKREKAQMALATAGARFLTTACGANLQMAKFLQADADRLLDAVLNDIRDK